MTRYAAVKNEDGGHDMLLGSGLRRSQTREPQRLQTSHGQQCLQLLTVGIDGHTANDDAVPQVRHRLHLAGRCANGAANRNVRLIGRRRIVLHGARDRNRGDQSQGTSSGEKAFRSVGYHLNYLRRSIHESAADLKFGEPNSLSPVPRGCQRFRVRAASWMDFDQALV